MGLKSWLTTRAILLVIGGKMGAVREFLQGKKTYLAVLAAILAALVAFADGSLSNSELLQAILNALALAGLRAGVTAENAKK